MCARYVLVAAACALLIGVACTQHVHVKPRPRKEDIGFIKCAACEMAAQELIDFKEREKKADEEKLLTVVETLCDPYQLHGEWLASIQIMHDQENRRLWLKKHEFPGRCSVDCVSAGKACLEALDDVVYEVVEHFVNHKDISVEDLRRAMCQEIGKACRSPPPPAPEDWKGNPFIWASEEELQMDRLRRVVGGNVQVMGSDDMPSMMQDLREMEDVDMGTDESPGAKRDTTEEHEANEAGEPAEAEDDDDDAEADTML